jgi:signal transduction histidine kinase
VKLLSRSSRYFLLFSVLILAVGSIFMVLALDAVLTEKVDESLVHTRKMLRKELAERDSIPARLEIMDKIIDFTLIPQDLSYAFYRDTVLLVSEAEDNELELEPFRKYVYTERINGKNYRVELNQAKFEKEDLALAMFGLIAGFLIIFLLILNWFNRYLSKRIWRPFHHLISSIQQFDVTAGQGIKPITSDIDEFALLAQSTSDMTAKLVKDYQSLKRFSENASHELQTPLAIILARTDLLLQRPNLDETSAEHLSAIQQASKRLTQLNRSLLLLTKIENQQFSTTRTNRLDKLIKQEIDAFAPLIAHHQLQLNLALSEVTVDCNTDLLIVLLQNLIGNAIKYNYENGELLIRLTDQELLLKNTSLQQLVAKPAELFDRFRKGEANSTSLGLGLAIVQEICELYHWQIDYLADTEYHTIRIQL